MCLCFSHFSRINFHLKIGCEVFLSNSNIKQLLSDYERKRQKAIYIAEQKKEYIYSQNPKLQEIDNELSSQAIATAKAMLNSNSPELMNNLKQKMNDLKNKKNTIVKSLNLDCSDFSPKYECFYCNDTGYITEGIETKMCNCLKQKLYNLEYNTFNVYNMQNQTFDNFLFTVYSDKVDKGKYNSDISPRENMGIIKKISLQFIKNFDNSEQKNLLFTGNSGLGKTFLSNCIANKLLSEGKTVLYQTAPVMLDSIISYRLR